MVTSKKRSLSFSVARSVTFSFARKAATGPIFLLLVPFTLHRVGAEGYGTWAIFGTLINMSFLLDFGLGAAVTKYIAEHSGKDDLRQVQRVLDTSLAAYLSIATVALCFLWFCSGSIIRELFRGPSAPAVSQVQSLWPLLLPIVAADLLVRPFTSLINGLQRMDLTNTLSFFTAVVSALLVVTFLTTGAKVDGLLLAALMTSLLSLVGNVVVAKRLLPSVTPNPLHCDLTTLKRMCAFSLALYAGQGLYLIQSQLEKLYLARFVGVVPVGWYSMASEAASKTRRIPDLLFGPVLAAASELNAIDERRKMGQLHFRVHKYLALTAVPLAIFAMLNAKGLVDLWVGPDLTVIAFPFAILVAGNLSSQIGGPAYWVLAGRGILRPSIYSALLASGLNIILSWVFIRQWGFSGAVFGTAIPMMIGSAYFLISSRRYFEKPFHQILQQAYFKPLLCSLCAAAATVPISLLRLGAWQSLLAGTIAYGATYIIGLLLTGFFDAFDLAKAEGHLPLLRFARRIVLAA
jgi:O-antigen/teichoic acid export membrane protein